MKSEIIDDINQAFLQLEFSIKLLTFVESGKLDKNGFDLDVFIDKENIQWLIHHLKERYPRHLVDQLKVLQNTTKLYPNYCEQALDEMKKLKLTSANDFRDIAHSLSVQSQRKSPAVTELNKKYIDLIAPERSEDIYLKVLAGGRDR